MKLCSKEALFIGGIYSVLATPFSYLKLQNVDTVNYILFSGFVLCFLMLFIKQFSGFIASIIQKHPKISYYLGSIGWLPYVMIISLVFIPLIAGIFEWSEDTLENILNIFNLIFTWGIPISLLIAFIIDKIKK